MDDEVTRGKGTNVSKQPIVLYALARYDTKPLLADCKPMVNFRKVSTADLKLPVKETRGQPPFFHAVHSEQRE